jgi:hypothetical protein
MKLWLLQQPKVYNPEDGIFDCRRREISNFTYQVTFFQVYAKSSLSSYFMSI